MLGPENGLLTVADAVIELHVALNVAIQLPLDNAGETLKDFLGQGFGLFSSLQPHTPHLFNSFQLYGVSSGTSPLRHPHDGPKPDTIQAAIKTSAMPNASRKGMLGAQNSLKTPEILVGPIDPTTFRDQF